MKLYLSPKADDPEWLARASMFHGHLGPWLVLGLLIGRDAVERLDTPGQWKIEVTCWMPTDKQRTPFSCILDGLQVSSGATLGKQNIRFNDCEEVLQGGWPVVYVVRREGEDRPAEGFVYEATEEVHRFFGQVTHDRLEESARELAGMKVEELCRIQAMGSREFALLDSASGGSTK